MEISEIKNNPGQYDVLERDKDEGEIQPTALMDEYLLSGFQARSLSDLATR